MGYRYSFDLTIPELQEMLAPAAKGLFQGLMRKLVDKGAVGIFEYLAGPTTVELSAQGLRVTNTQGTQEIPWSGIRVVNERHLAWVIQRDPNGLVVVPVSAVPQGERADLAEQLRSWAPKYRVREGLEGASA
ncbi:YcxB family protein [Streptacidiphilus fuscans]|uniref:YcxB family protein n=1 Tax=Streptacidiphilus fuscans TaxID=2789292 RepID=A0A931B7Q0_9ACTN|nr:YcxB family protein [Streptacidiphilus fuscans]MBF9072745.1 YcxB family protein [Streptacidiphilus fuscans]